MHIRKLHLQNFKRFTDLTIADIPDKTKLVLLIGNNGSGKSSIFDAFELLAVQNGKIPIDPSVNYRKNPAEIEAVIIETFEGGEEGLIASSWKRSGILQSGSFYGRTSFRQVPRLSRTSVGTSFNIQNDGDRPGSFIDRDLRFENDLEHLFGRLLKEFFRSNEDKSEIKSKVINPINQALDRIFNKDNGTKLTLLEIIPPLEGRIAEINFRKGSSIFHYNYLSAGEKEVFNILINFIARSEYFHDTIYYMDEIDLHLNTGLQFNLLKEITTHWIPPGCQFWTASHSLGFIDYARQADDAVTIDLDNLDFDFPHVLVPESKDSYDVYDIAVSKAQLSSLFRDLTICFVENKDREFYGSFGISNTVFVSDNNRNNVFHKVRTTNHKGIVDRDFLSDEDLIEIKKHYPRLSVLKFYSIENYLYHPDNLAEYHSSQGKPFDKAAYITDLTDAKNDCKNSIIPSLSLKRTEYPYFCEPEFNGTPLQNRFKNTQENMDQSAIIAEYLNSDDLQTFYKVLSMKTYCTTLYQRQHITKNELINTSWFKREITELIQGNQANI